MWGAIRSADVVYPCTSSTTPLIAPDELKRCMAARVDLKRNEVAPVTELSGQISSDAIFDSVGSCPVKEQAADGDCIIRESVSPSKVHLQFTPELPLRFVDLSVPRNVHPLCKNVEGVECYNVDDLQEVVHLNTAKRQGEIGRAEDIIRGEIKQLHRWQESLGAIPTINRLQEKAEEMRLCELEKSMKDLIKLSPEDLRTVDRLSRGIVGKLLSGPMEHLRNTNNNRMDETATAISEVQKTFHSMLKS